MNHNILRLIGRDEAARSERTEFESLGDITQRCLAELERGFEKRTVIAGASAPPSGGTAASQKAKAFESFVEIRGYIDGQKKFTAKDESAIAVLALMHSDREGCSPDGWLNLGRIIRKLRKMGILIDTARIGGRSPALYVLRSRIDMNDFELRRA
jgi:hypothetical protein